MYVLQFLLNKLNLFCFGIILCSTIIIEFGIKRGWFSFFIGRKVLHIIAIITCAYCIYHSINRNMLSYLFLAFAIVLAVLVYKKLFATSNNQSYGIAIFPFAFFVLLQMPFLHIHTVLFSIVTLAFADAIAGYMGYTYSKQKIVFLQEPKSWIGFFSFYMITLFLYFGYFGYTFFYLGFLIALVPALTELFSYKGSDNFSVPIVTALWFYAIQSIPNATLLQNTYFLILMLVLAFLAYYKKWLTVSGATASFLIGCLVIFFGSIIYLVPLAIFLITGSLASTISKDKEEKTGRSAIQVFANGIIATICLVIFYFTLSHVFWIAFFASIAISMTDTMSSEIGKYFKQTTYDIVLWKKTAVGLSGGVSLYGSIAGLLASALFSIVVYFIFALSVQNAMLVFSIGFVGMLVDSVLGSVLQAKYKNVYGIVVENKTNSLIKGYAWCTNDVVNVLSNMMTILGFIALYLFCK